jgi:hypothetical protein
VSTDHDASPAPITTERPRTSRRFKIFRRGSWIVSGSEKPQTLHLLDISTNGARAHADNHPEAQAQIIVDCGHPIGSARVRWVAGKMFGLQFRTPLTVEQLTDIIEQD